MSPKRSVAEQGNNPIEDVEVGQIDPMSRLARQVSIKLCGYKRCTRAAGHSEGTGNHPALKHVRAVGPDYIADKVWSH